MDRRLIPVDARHDVLGVLVDTTDYQRAVDRIIAAAEERRPFAVSALAVHGVMTAHRDPALRARINGMDMVTPDGQPVRWALNRLHGARLRDRVAGPELTLRVVGAAAERGLPIYLYGSREEVITRLREEYLRRFPGLRIAGVEPSRFRAAHAGEDEDLARRIQRSGARLVLVGLGCPRQELFVSHMRSRLNVPLLAVGAAFDYHAGLLKRPPRVLQRAGLEWAWRLALEPRRLWRRYVLLNPWYALLVMAQWTRVWRPRVLLPSPADPHLAVPI